MPNNSFKPNLLRYTNNAAEKSCHVVGSATQVGLTQALAFRGSNMGGLLDELANPVWWFSVVLAGIVVNLISSYLKVRLDRSLSATAGWWRHRSQSRQKAWEAYVAHLASNAEARDHARYLELRARLQAVVFLIFSVVLGGIGMLTAVLASPHARYVSIAALGFASLVMLLSYLCISEAVRKGQAIHAALSES